MIPMLLRALVGALGRIARFIFQEGAPEVPTPGAGEKLPALEVKEDAEVVGDKAGRDRAAARPYMTRAMRRLLALIRKHEGGDDAYNADYAKDDRWHLTSKTVRAVRDLGRSQVSRQGEPSSAIGAYQFLTKTLDSLIAQLGLTGGEIFDEALQDDLAIALMIRRARATKSAHISKVTGQLVVTNPTKFAIELAKEWASLPVPIAMRGAHRTLKAGQSYYTGDSLNRSHHSVASVMAAVNALATEDQG